MESRLQNYGHLPIGVIVPAYNAEETIERALTSIAVQSKKPTEVVVVDDGSGDQTFKLARSMEQTLAEIKLTVLTQPNQGAGAARNFAIERINAELVAFLDADDEWLPEKLSTCWDKLSSGEVTFLAHNGWISDNGTESYVDISSRFHASADQVYAGLYKRGFISTSSVIARRRDIAAVRGFDTSLTVGQDFDLWLKLAALGDTKISVLDDPLTRYHVTKGSITSQTAKRLESTLLIALRHAPTLRARPGGTWKSFMFRIAAIHWEAMQAYRNKRRFAAMLSTFLKLGLRVVTLSIWFTSGAKPGEENTM